MKYSKKMISFRTFFFYSAFFYLTNAQTIEDVEGYYWREYKGTIPSDALPGGSDGNGNTIYIGQVRDFKHLVPGQINRNENKLYYVYPLLNSNELLAQTSSVNVKILCTRHPEQLEWIKTTTADIKDLATKRSLISAGCLYENPDEGSVYIGKALEIENISIGVIITNFTDPDFIKWEGLHVYKGSESVNSYDTFEVLSYNPDIPSEINNLDVETHILKMEKMPTTNNLDTSQDDVKNVSNNVSSFKKMPIISLFSASDRNVINPYYILFNMFIIYRLLL